MKKKFMAFLLMCAMVLSQVAPALANDTADYLSKEPLLLGELEDYEEYLPEEALEDADEDDKVTWNMAIAYLLRKAGMTEAQLGNYPGDYIGMADSLGLISYDENREFAKGEKTITLGNFSRMAMKDGLVALEEAMAAETKEPLFVNGMAQPIFPFTTGAHMEGYNA